MNALKNTGNPFRVSITDILIALLILSFGGGLLVMRGHDGGPDRKVVIHKAGAIILETPLDEDRIMDLESYGDSMIIEIRDRKVRVVSSSCPQQICVRKGFTGHVQDPVICVPNQVMIEISGVDTEYDAVSY